MADRDYNEYRIWNRHLSESQVRENYCKETGRDQHDLDAEIWREREVLKEALTNSCNLLENYIDTFGDMSGANRADLNDYRAVLTAYDERGK